MPIRGPRRPTRSTTVAEPTGSPTSASDAELVAAVERRVSAVLTGERRRWAALDPALDEPLAALERLVLAGGKRLRPRFCHWGFVAAGGDPADDRVVDAGAALELLHAFALVHDDVMDGSDTRRRQPAVHAEFRAAHERNDWRGEARRFGEGVAILVGDLAGVFADRLLADAPDAARAAWHELKIEINVGQYLDVVGTVQGATPLESARRISRYKSGKYTIERPLHLGAALAGDLERLQAPLSAYGDPLGEAFQLRDDLLGAFGDPAVTGKPVGDDLQEGKPTPLLAIARQRASPAQLGVLAEVGRADLDDGGVAGVQDVLVATGAVDEIERTIAARRDGAVAAIERAPIAAAARAALVELAAVVTDRTA